MADALEEVLYAGPQIKRTAGAGGVSGHRPIALVGGLAVHANKDNPAHLGLVRGISLGAAIAGDTAYVQAFGPLSDPSFNWTPGLPIFVGSGVLTQTPPASGWLQQIAVAETATRIFVDLQPPISLL